jgi:peptidyl-tRNA hydrolase
MRIGIGRGTGQPTRQVLSRFTSDEARFLPAVLEAAADCVIEWERNGIINAMNRCNRAPESENGSAPPIEER